MCNITMSYAVEFVIGITNGVLDYVIQLFY
jgi:hypothetical protein